MIGEWCLFLNKQTKRKKIRKYKSWLTVSIKAKSICKHIFMQLVLFSLRRNNVFLFIYFFCFCVFNLKTHLSLIVFIPCPSVGWLYISMTDKQKESGRVWKKYEKKKKWCVWVYEYVHILFPFAFLCRMSYLGVKSSREKRREGGKGVGVRGFSGTWHPCRWDLSWSTMCAWSP